MSSTTSRRNHEAYAQHRTVIAASAVTWLVKGSARDVVPAAGWSAARLNICAGGAETMLTICRPRSRVG
jgi:hypothetical protein